MTYVAESPGGVLKQWRQRRRLSQFALAIDTGISQRHLSFVESGRALASRPMLLMLASKLKLPRREQNRLLLSAGFAPEYSERRFEGADFESARSLVEIILAGHEPWPSLAVDQRWTLLAANRSVSMLLSGIHERLLKPPVNVLRLSLHPDGLASRILNYAEWRTHILDRLTQQVEESGDPALVNLANELESYPSPIINEAQTASGTDWAGLAVPLQLQTEQGVLSFVSTSTVFGTPTDITLSDIVIESFFPADKATSKLIRNYQDISCQKLF